MVEVFILLLFSLFFAIAYWYFLIKKNYRQGRNDHNQNGPSLGRWTPGRSITCVCCQTRFVMPQNAQQRVKGMSIGRGVYWERLTPDDYCPNKNNHPHFWKWDQRYGKNEHPPLQPSTSDRRREPRDLLLVPGDRVTHPVFGVGEVLAVQGEGREAEATVKFDSRGIKRLATAWAPITKHE